MKKISVIIGTRPEAIKMAPVVKYLRAQGHFSVHLCSTGQHREMLKQVLDVFDLTPDVDLSLMEPNQTLASLSARAIVGVDQYLAEQQPDMVLVQGDTTTVFAASLAAFYRQIPVGHVEAGLRTWNKRSPFPEEINRVMTSHLADLHFAPTEWSRQNLLKEGIAESQVFVTGNTVIDALHLAVKRVRSENVPVDGLDESFLHSAAGRIVLITGHRRENLGQGFEDICKALTQLAEHFPTHQFVYPVHLNPRVREPVFRILGNHENIHLIQPQAYLPFVRLMDLSCLILTDSGGVQEEAPSLGKPVLVMRDTTERPEAVEAGTVRLVGTDCAKIVAETTELLTSDTAREAMSRAHNPYGDGKASQRIAEVLVRWKF